MKLSILLVTLISSSVTHAASSTCEDVFSTQPLVSQLATLRTEAEAKRAAGDLTLAKVLYANYTRLFQEARDSGLDLSNLARASRQAHESADTQARKKAEQANRAIQAEGLRGWVLKDEFTLEGSAQHFFSLSGDGTRIAYALYGNRSAGTTESLRVVSVDRSIKQPLFSLDFDRIGAVAVDWAANTLVVGDYPMKRIFTADQGLPLWTFDDRAFALGKGDVAYHHGRGISIETVSPRKFDQTYALPHTWRTPISIERMKFTQNGRYLVIASNSGRIIFDRMKQINVWINHSQSSFGESGGLPALSNEGTSLILFNSPKAELLRPDTGELIASISVPEGEMIRDVQFSPDSKTFLIRTNTGHLRAYSTVDGSFIRDFRGEHGIVSFNFTDDSGTLALFSNKGEAGTIVQLYSPPALESSPK